MAIGMVSEAAVRGKELYDAHGKLGALVAPSPEVAAHVLLSLARDRNAVYASPPAARFPGTAPRYNRAFAEMHAYEEASFAFVVARRFDDAIDALNEGREGLNLRGIHGAEAAGRLRELRTSIDRIREIGILIGRDASKVDSALE